MASNTTCWGVSLRPHDHENLPGNLGERLRLGGEQQGRRVKQHQPRRILAGELGATSLMRDARQQLGRVRVRVAGRQE